MPRGYRCKAGVKLLPVQGRPRFCAATPQKTRQSIANAIDCACPHDYRANDGCLPALNIIAVGFKVNSERAVQFRKWVNTTAKDYTRGDRIRTCDIQLPKLALYQAELRPV